MFKKDFHKKSIAAIAVFNKVKKDLESLNKEAREERQRIKTEISRLQKQEEDTLDTILHNENIITNISHIVGV